MSEIARWACGWTGERCMRLGCSKVGPCEGVPKVVHRSDAEDAARYRYLREQIGYGSSDLDLWFQWYESWGPYHKGRSEAEALDAAIDAAMHAAAAGGTEEGK